MSLIAVSNWYQPIPLNLLEQLQEQKKLSQPNHVCKHTLTQGVLRGKGVNLTPTEKSRLHFLINLYYYLGLYIIYYFIIFMILIFPRITKLMQN